MTFALRIAKTRFDAILPRRGSVHAAGFDLHAADDAFVPAGKHVLIPTGVAVELPHGMVALVCPRSGLALKSATTVLNAPGVVDSDYRGEVKVLLVNHGDADLRVAKGDRVAQLLFVRHEVADLIETDIDNLAKTDRGQGGFGSTGA